MTQSVKILRPDKSGVLQLVKIIANPGFVHDYVNKKSVYSKKKKAFKIKEL